MGVNFPDSPTNGQTTTVGNTTYSYNSSVGAWEIVSSGGIGTMTTKGDLLSRSSSGLARVGVGTNNQVLVADSAQTAGVAWTDKPWNTAWGQVAYASRTTNLSSIGTTATEVTSVTFTAVANRRYAITGNCNAYKEGSSNYAQALIYNGSTQIGRIGLTYLNAGREQTFCGTMFETPGAGSVTYKLMILFSANTLNEVYASSTGPAYIQVSDIGPA